VKAHASARQAEYQARHRAEISAWQGSYRETNREKLRGYNAAYRAMPSKRAAKFLREYPDCTSTVEDVAAAYATEQHAATGQPGRIGPRAWDLCLGHIHGGPIVGLIYGWENHAMTENVLEHWGAFEETMRLHARAS
jgi:hypothetical protein